MPLNQISYILRRYRRQKLTTFLHITGLTLGITVCLLIGLFIRYEMSFDSSYEKASRTYRVNQVWVDDGKKEFHFSTPFPLANQIRKDITGLENVTQMHNPHNNIIEINPLKRFNQEYVMMTDPEFLDVFDVKVVEGNAHEALRKPYQALLTQSTAKKFYGNEDPMGKVFKYNDEFDITVAGVIKDFPGNTHLPATMILSFADDEKYVQTSRTHYGSVSGGSTFIVLPKGMPAGKSLIASLNGIYDRTVNKEPWMRKNSYCEMEIQPLGNIHYNSKYADGGEWVKAINTSWLWFFGSVGLAVLALACINFINLSTAQALTRAKEVGVRKTIGAGRLQLITQFVGEALLLVLFSAILAVIVSKLSLPAINRLTEKQITFDLFHSASMFGVLLLGVLVTALLSGLYPAWLITKFKPATTLKSGSVNANPQSAFLRKGLVVTQFTISVCLLIGVLLIGRQMNYMRSKNLGFDKDNIVMITLPREGNNEANKKIFREQLLSIAQVKDISFSTSAPSGDKYAHWGTIMSLNGRDDKERKEVTTILTDEHFCQMYGLHLEAGRFFVPVDTNAVSESIPEGQRFPKCVVNEKLVTAMGFGTPQAALGKKFWIGINGWQAEVVGVVADFNVNSLREEIKPTLVTQFFPYTDKAGIKIKANADMPVALSRIQAVYKNYFPKGIFEYDFLDQQLDNLYKAEARLYSLFRIFSILAILISCLGLWGLITFAAQQRVKEIGIRKVLGASVANVVMLLTKDFIILVSIAIAIATPLAYWGVSSWLKDFAFRIHIGWTVFVFAGISAILIALITVSFQAIRAAIMNPVKSLRTE